MATQVVYNGITEYKGRDGKTYKLDLKGADGYYFNNLFRQGDRKQMSAAIELMLDTGKIPTKEELKNNGVTLSNNAYKNIQNDLIYFLKANGTDIDTYRQSAGLNENDPLDMTDPDDREIALSDYYRDIYSTERGTLGGDIYNRLVQAEQNAALSNMQLADANYQQQAMQQAQTVKAITDQVRSERIARLRAGMSESQIANQDMQTLMSNMNALNQQAAYANAARLQAQQQYQNAQDTAYQAWLGTINPIGQTGAAYDASRAGDIMQQAKIYAATNKVSIPQAVEKLTNK